MEKTAVKVQRYLIISTVLALAALVAGCGSSDTRPNDRGHPGWRNVGGRGHDPDWRNACQWWDDHADGRHHLRGREHGCGRDERNIDWALVHAGVFAGYPADYGFFVRPSWMARGPCRWQVGNDWRSHGEHL
jgi:hypothetical protein